jgi:hypothetical protein
MRAVLRRAALSDAHVFTQGTPDLISVPATDVHTFTHGCAQIDFLSEFSARRAFDLGTSE